MSGLDAFERLLHKHHKSRFLVIDPESGFGDELILHGLEKKLREQNIRYTLLKIRKSHPTNKLLAGAINSIPTVQRIIRASRAQGLETRVRIPTRQADESSTSTLCRNEQVVLLRGGAYLNDIWKGYGVLHSASKMLDRGPGRLMIIAPQSFYFSKPQLPRAFVDVKQEMHIFCRETDSYKLLRSLHKPRNIHVHLSHDTALYLTPKDFTPAVNRGKYVLVAPRLDRESVVKWRVKRIRRSNQMPVVSKDVNLLRSYSSFVETISDSAVVYTDRLHVSILSAILGKETYLLPNSYHKNKSAYEYSLKRFPNVNFINTKEYPIPET